MNPLWLFDTCGIIFGPAIWAAGLAAFAVCAWVTFRSTSRRPRRFALTLATLPIILGLCGFLTGLALVWSGHLPTLDWVDLGKVLLAGAVTSVVPLIWALLLVRSRVNSTPPIVPS